MAAELESRKRRKRTSKGRTKTGWRLNGKALAGALREAVNDLTVAYATCVTVQTALRAQNADEDSELEICLRNHVAATISRQIEELGLLAQTLGPTAESVSER